MLYPLDDSIIAVASPAGGAARGIVRLSGLDVLEQLRPHFQCENGRDLAQIRAATVIPGHVRVGSGTLIPCDLYAWPTSRSYTGQPAAEVHMLGSLPLMEAFVRALLANGFRLAEPGEFTLRAFLAGRLDLTQAEAVLGVIDAADPRQFDVALAQLAGGLAGPLRELRGRLLDLLAHLEAGFDFADEDLPFIAADEIACQLSEAIERISRLADQMKSRSETAEVIRVALVGRPNVGKSSLFNALTGKPGALVFDEAGTTRDYLTAALELDGVRCLLTDTAGLAMGSDSVAQEVSQAAQAVSSEQARQARIRLLCLDSTRLLDAAERNLLQAGGPEMLAVLTKCDLPQATDLVGSAVRTSSSTGEGIVSLKSRLRAAVLGSGIPDGDAVAGTVVRCHGSLSAASESLRRAWSIVRAECAEELVAAEVRTALEELGKVAGAVYTEDVLERIFSRFCIGK